MNLGGFEGMIISFIVHRYTLYHYACTTHLYTLVRSVVDTHVSMYTQCLYKSRQSQRSVGGAQRCQPHDDIWPPGRNATIYILY